MVRILGGARRLTHEDNQHGSVAGFFGIDEIAIIPPASVGAGT